MTSLSRLIELDAPARLRARDAALFSSDPAEQLEIAKNLGWTELVADAAAARGVVEAVAADVLADGATDIILLGMGGSSLASLVIGSVLGEESGVRLRVLDTTSPIMVGQVLDEVDLARSVFIVASKSGTTIEPLSLYAIFRSAVEKELGPEAAGARFVAITDPGTPLESLAHDSGFRAVVPAPPSVGGRYSALTTFGLLPAALLGVDLDELLERARAMEADCALAAEHNPGAKLAAFAVDAHAAGRDKLTVIASPGLESFGLWVEQLVAESLGKDGTGIVPVAELSPDKPQGYGRDRALVLVRFESDKRLAGWAEQWRSSFPVCELVLRDGYDLAAEFVRWEHAVALMGPLLGVNPFGQPNVAAAKAATAGVLDGTLDAPVVAARTAEDGVGITFLGGLDSPGHVEQSVGTALGHAVAALRRGDFLALLAYLPDDQPRLGSLADVVPAVSNALGVPVALELGPRYLHSTGQLHKGGADEGVFVMVTADDPEDVDVPGQPWGLRELYRAQAMGDLVTLSNSGRRVLWLDLRDSGAESIGALVRGLADAAGVVTEED